MDKEYEQLRDWIEHASRIVFLGGAGVSTESGIPDFRGKNGLYRQKRKIPLETILSRDFFLHHPEEFYKHMRTMDSDPREPNQAHRRLAELEHEGKLSAVITQNVDGLHQKAGSKTVYELHGNADCFHCMECGAEYDRAYVLKAEGVPHCTCGGIIRPGAVLFGDMIDPVVLTGAINAIRQADMLIVGGTSLQVYPAAGLITEYAGDRLVLINEQPTPYDNRADLVIVDKIGEVFSVV